MFAKLFKHEKYGQVLVTKETSDDNEPKIKIRFEIEGAEIDFAVGYEKGDKGFEKRDFYFNNITNEQVAANVEAVATPLTIE